jgi:hypothetical protein
MPAPTLAGSRGLCQLLRSTGLDVPVVVVISEGALVALSADCGCDEILLPTAGPAEVDARLRLLVGSSRDTCKSGNQSILKGQSAGVPSDRRFDQWVRFRTVGAGQRSVVSRLRASALSLSVGRL